MRKDQLIDFEKILREVQQFRDARDWKKFHDLKSLAEALSIESSELLELFLWKDKKEVEEFIKVPKNREEIEDEVVDIFHNLLLFIETLSINLNEASRKKLEKNSLKYPIEKTKGKATKYTKL